VNVTEGDIDPRHTNDTMEVRAGPRHICTTPGAARWAWEYGSKCRNHAPRLAEARTPQSRPGTLQAVEGAGGGRVALNPPRLECSSYPHMLFPELGASRHKRAGLQ
jgi:hypothetical protein